MTERAAVAQMWNRRARAELHSAGILALVTAELIEGGADSTVLAMASRASADEVRHAEICRCVAERYCGEPTSWPPPTPVALPRYEGVDPHLRRALHVLGMCCISETIATAFLEASLSSAKAPLARAALRELLTDEIDHARLGWAHLATLEPATRAEIGSFLPPFIRDALAIWTTQNPPAIVGGVPAHGLLARATSDAVVIRAVQEMVLPGLARLGVETDRAARLIAQRVDKGSGA